MNGVGHSRLVPELYCTDFTASLRFYTEVLGFSVCYDRPEECFAYLAREGAELMIEQTVDHARRFVIGALKPPLGRGMNLQIEVSAVDALYATVCDAGAKLFLPIEERWYRRGAEAVGNRQFVVADPDGYLLRFFESLGARPVP